MKPFVPGQHDCAIFASGWVEAMTGTDVAKDWRGKYKTIAGGYRLIRESGYADHVDFVCKNFQEVPPSFAQVGDMAVVSGDDGLALGGVQGEIVFVLHPSGSGFVPLTSAMRAFAVGVR